MCLCQPNPRYDEEEAYGDTIYACSDKVAEKMEEVIKKAEEIQNVAWEKLKKEAEKARPAE